jgi:hypothetical protein
MFLRSILLILALTATGAAQSNGEVAKGPQLAGTSWQLIKFQGGDGTTLTGSLHDHPREAWGFIRHRRRDS